MTIREHLKYGLAMLGVLAAGLALNFIFAGTSEAVRLVLMFAAGWIAGRLPRKRAIGENG